MGVRNTILRSGKGGTPSEFGLPVCGIHGNETNIPSRHDPCPKDARLAIKNRMEDFIWITIIQPGFSGDGYVVVAIGGLDTLVIHWLALARQRSIWRRMMGNVTQFRLKKLAPLDEMCRELNEDKGEISAAIVLVRRKSGEIYVLGHGGDEHGNDLLQLQRSYAAYIEECFSDAIVPA